MKSEEAPPTRSGPAAAAWLEAWARPWQQLADYAVDLTQRWLIYLDVRRKAANNMLDHHAAGMPPVLAFEHELILDARTFERPANYALLRIVPPPEVELDPTKPPLVIVDPRAGHGPGVGGFKEESEVGMALREGFATYFVVFFPEPCPGQTLEDIELAEIRFLEEVHRRHPDVGRPVLYGNCQAGWAVAMLGADRPDVCGPIVLNGAPLSYWAGRAGATPMRAMGGLSGGDWGVQLACDLGRGRFDGAWLVENFERLDPANAVFKKDYELLRDVDSVEQRFLDFERWWTGFYQLEEGEITWISDNLFIGNDLEQGVLHLGEDHVVDLRQVRDPIVVFASSGDSITPPAQALGWVHEVYGSTAELKRHGQRVIYLLHQHAGHLGIFVSAAVARREHRAIIENLERFPELDPGLYQMVIAGETGETDPRRPQFVVRFEERQVEQLCFNTDGDEAAFARAERLDRWLDGVYRSWFRPWIRPAISPATAELLKWLHPARSKRLAFSERLNPLMLGVPPLARLARAPRQGRGGQPVHPPRARRRLRGGGRHRQLPRRPRQGRGLALPPGLRSLTDTHRPTTTTSTGRDPMDAPPRSAVLRPAALAAALLATVCCSESGKGKTTPGSGTAQVTAPKPAAGTAPAKPANKKAAPASAPAARPFPPASGKALDGVKVRRRNAHALPRRLSLYALAGAPAVPKWASGADPARARDDDLLTGWSCAVGGDKPCALGVRFPQPAEVRVLRLFSGSGGGLRDFRRHGKAKLLRVHSDGGWVEAKLKRWRDYQYLFFKPALQTRSLVVEVREAYAGKGKAAAPLQIAELELFGAKGQARPPLALDPAQTIFRFDHRIWFSGRRGTTAAALWTEVVEDAAAGKVRRLLRGARFFNRKGDRFLLLQRPATASCPGVRYTETKRHTLIDTKTRAFYMVRFGGERSCSITPHRRGAGFACVGTDAASGEPSTLFTLRFAGDRVKRRKRELDGEPDTLLKRGGFRGRRARMSSGCRKARPPRAVARMVEHGDWLRCKAGSHTAWVAGEQCSGPWAMAVVNAAGKVVSRRKGKGEGEGSGATVGRLPDGMLLISTDRAGGDAGDIYTVDSAGKLKKTFPKATLAPGSPSGCRCSA